MRCKGCGALLEFRDLPVLLHGKELVIKCCNCEYTTRLEMCIIVPYWYDNPHSFRVEVKEIE